MIRHECDRDYFERYRLERLFHYGLCLIHGPESLYRMTRLEHQVIWKADVTLTLTRVEQSDSIE